MLENIYDILVIIKWLLVCSIFCNVVYSIFMIIRCMVVDQRLYRYCDTTDEMVEDLRNENGWEDK